MDQPPPIAFSFYRGAIDDPNTPRSVYTAIGRVATAWARIEQHIDAVLLQVNKKDHSEELYREHPVSFKGKIKLLNRWFNNYPPLAVHKAEMQVLTRTLKLMSTETRNPLLHSVFGAYDPLSRTLTFQSMRTIGDDTFNLREFKIDLNHVKELSAVINQGNQILGLISRDLFSPDGVARLQKP